MEMQLIVPALSVPIVPVIAANPEPLALFGDFFGRYGQACRYLVVESPELARQVIALKVARAAIAAAGH